MQFVFQDGVRFFIYFEDNEDYELDADSVEEKNKVRLECEAMASLDSTGARCIHNTQFGISRVCVFSPVIFVLK